MNKDHNTGYRNTGNWNTGYYNTGNCNTGNYNTGDWNTGNCNTGYHNTGDCNTGDWNTGYRNTGNWNTGNWNTGNYNTGDWNTGNYNTGYCNTITPDTILVFNKPCKRKEWADAIKPDWMFTTPTKWVCESKMSDKEKEAYPSYVTTGGYLKCYSSLQHAYIEAWEKATDKDRKLTLKLPNFDIEVFKEIFGFDPSKNLKKKPVTLELTDEQLERIKEILD